MFDKEHLTQHIMCLKRDFTTEILENTQWLEKPDVSEGSLSLCSLKCWEVTKTRDSFPNLNTANWIQSGPLPARAGMSTVYCDRAQDSQLHSPGRQMFGQSDGPVLYCELDGDHNFEDYLLHAPE